MVSLHCRDDLALRYHGRVSISTGLFEFFLVGELAVDLAAGLFLVFASCHVGVLLVLFARHGVAGLLLEEVDAYGIHG